MRIALAGLSLLLSLNITPVSMFVYPEIDTNTNGNTQTNIEMPQNEETPVSLTVKDTELYAKGAVLIDAVSGRVLYEKNGFQSMPMASTTKIMTCIVALENANLDDKVTVSKYASTMPDVQLNINKGEEYYLKDLLYSLMLESHNDTAVAIAEYIGSTATASKTPAEERTIEESKESVLKFADLMNQKARDIGCYNTYFITPNGLDAKTRVEDETGNSIEKVHSTTASDLAGIMRYCILNSPKKDAFLEITSTPSYSFSDVDGKRSFSCNNHNAFLSMMEGALSGKTGFTGEAGYCYVGALSRENRTFIVALLACGWPNNKTYKWSDTKKLMNYGLENYSFQNFDSIPIDNSKIQPITVLNGQNENVGESPKIDLKLVQDFEGQAQGMLVRPDEKIELRYEIPQILNAPISDKTVVGTIKYMLNGEVWRVDNIVTDGSIEKITIKWCLEQLLELYFF